MIDRSLLVARCVGVPQALLEAAIGYLCLLLIAVASGRVGAAPIALAFTILGWLWLALWPAWRLRPSRARHWWLRWPNGFLRIMSVVTLLAVIGAGLAALLHPVVFGGRLLPAIAIATVAPGFLAGRAVVDLAAVIRCHLRRRLRWQLMASHVTAIVLTVVLIAGVGSLTGALLVASGTQPDSRSMAESIADYLQLTDSVRPLNHRQMQSILEQIESGRLPVRGQPSLARFIGQTAPGPILVESTSGKLLASVGGANARQLIRHQSILDALRGRALQGRASAYSSESGPFRPETTEYAGAPIRAGGKVKAVVLLRGYSLDGTPSQLWRALVTFFSVATILLIGASALPILLLSFLFAFLVAGSLTRRLESVSQVAQAIARGEFKRRAPVTSQNEIGRLAEDINRMAAELETTVTQIRTARGEAEEALRIREELVANVSHELRTPLAIMRSHLEALALHAALSNGGGEPEATSDVVVPMVTIHALQAEAERLESLVDGLFALSRAQSGALAIQHEPVDLGELVGEVVAMMRPLAQREGRVALIAESAASLPCALADRERLRQIILNLVRNAVRHTPEGGIVALTVAAEGPWLTLSVADTGEGVSAEHLPHIFERFYRVDQSRTRDSGGAGLGLAIVREFVELMGGRVTAESIPEQGSIFRVSLPVARPHVVIG